MHLAVVVAVTCCFFSIAEGFLHQDDQCTIRRNDEHLNAKQTIRKYGYPVEAHTIQTADGYLLELHRIPYGSKGLVSGHSSLKKPPVFLEHGGFGSSDDYLIPGPNRALPFLLADLGFDVWLGNHRGNYYSRAHVTMAPSDKKFWDFSLHEAAIYDLAAEIDFVRAYTKQDKVIFVGLTMGTTVFLVLMSTIPEYNNKIEVAHLMSNTAYSGNLKSPVLRVGSLFTGPFKKAIELFKKGELIPQSDARANFIKTVFGTTDVGRKLFLSSVFAIVGYDYEMFDETLFDTFFTHYPSGFSVKTFDYFAQKVRTGEFKRYDYGAEENKKRYGCAKPPFYNLQNVKVPMYFYQAQNDLLSTLKDAMLLANDLKTVQAVRVIEYPKFNHFDFMVAKNVKEQVFDLIIQDMIGFLKNKTLTPCCGCNTK